MMKLIFKKKRSFSLAIFFQYLILACLSERVQSLAASGVDSNLKTCYFGAGCFWEPADKLRGKEGIVSTTVGYCGDDDYTIKNLKKNKKPPDYEVICNGRTRFVEAVRVEYDEQKLLYEDILNLFAEVNTAQWNNKRQYQGVLFTSNKEEEEIAKSFLKSNKVVATVEPMSQFFHSAEPYHQNYWAKFRTRLAVLIPLLFATDKFAGENAQQYFNILVYGFFAFVLLERKFDAKVETFTTTSVPEEGTLK